MAATRWRCRPAGTWYAPAPFPKALDCSTGPVPSTASSCHPATRSSGTCAASLLQHESILEVLGEGIAVLCPDLRVQWANVTFEHWCGGPAIGKSIHEALHAQPFFGADPTPFITALAGKNAATRIAAADDRYLELRVTPMLDQTGACSRSSSCAATSPPKCTSSKSSTPCTRPAGSWRAERRPARRHARRGTRRTPQAQHPQVDARSAALRRHRNPPARSDDAASSSRCSRGHDAARPPAASCTPSAEGNGVTGFVAATGKSYRLHRHRPDPLYIEGAEGARSSLTVALSGGDKVIGTFNVESPQPGAFGAAGPAVRRNLLPRDRLRPAHARPAPARETADRVRSRSRPSTARSACRSTKS